MTELAITWQVDRGNGLETLGTNRCMAQGLQNFLDVLFGLGGTTLNGSNLRLAVGDDGSSATINNLTKLQAETNSGNFARQVVSANFPALAGPNYVVARASFGSGVANFTWREYGLAWGAANTATLMSRQVDPLPQTKVSGKTWILYAAITLT